MKRKVLLFPIWFVAFLFGYVFLSFASDVPSYDKLCRAIKPPSGWSVIDKCSGINVQGTQMGSGVMVSEKLKKDGHEFEIVVVGGFQASAQWMNFGNIRYAGNDKGFLKKVNIRGKDAVLVYEKKDRNGSVVVCLKEQGPMCIAIFALTFEGLSPSEAVECAREFDLSGVSDLFKNMSLQFGAQPGGPASMYPPVGSGIPGSN